MSKGAGKGDCPRPYDRKKWEAGWAAYEKGKKDEEKENDVQGSEEADNTGWALLHSRQRRKPVRNSIKIMGMDIVYKSRLDDA